MVQKAPLKGWLKPNSGIHHRFQLVRDFFHPRYIFIYVYLDCSETPCHVKCSQIMTSSSNSDYFLCWWALCTRKVNYPVFSACESILGRKSTTVMCYFDFLSLPIILHLFPLIFSHGAFLFP